MSVAIPRRKDVLFGKGTSINVHHGNVLFRSIVERHKPRFLKAKRAEKRVVASEIVLEIMHDGGRFLMEQPDCLKRLGQANAVSKLPPETSMGNDEDAVTDKFIMDRNKVWVVVDEDRVIEKVMHRLREKSVKPKPVTVKTEEESTVIQESVARASLLQLGTSVRTNPEDAAPDIPQKKRAKSGVFSAVTPGANFQRSAQAAATPITSSGSSFNGEASAIPQIQQIVSQSAREGGTNPVTAATSPSSRPVPVGIPYWIKSTSALAITADSYLKEAVNLSYLITIEVIRAIAAAEVAVPDISADNVVIYVYPPTSLFLPIRSVQLRKSVVALMSMEQRLQCSSLPLSSRAVCAALGQILLTIFSWGKSSLHEQQLRLIAPESASMTPPMINRLLLELRMPLSVRLLLCDLANASNMMIPELSLEEVHWDLEKFRNDPDRFLYDRTSPQRALHDTHLFDGMDKSLFGREKELGVLMAAKNNIADFFAQEESGGSNKEVDFSCEAIVLSGYAGSGKSCLVQSLMYDCTMHGWFVISMNFGKNTDSFNTRMKGFNDFFEYWASNKTHDPAMLESFDQVCRLILSTFDKDGLSQLCKWIPNLGKITDVSLSSTATGNGEQSSSIDKAVDFNTNRRRGLFGSLLKSICSVGRPVLLAMDDLQWCDSICDLTKSLSGYLNLPCARKEEFGHHGLMFVGTLRSNEIEENGPIAHDINDLQQCQEAKVTKLEIGGLVESDIVKFLSAKLCLPMRYTKELASLVHNKTRGNPFFIIQFLKTIIQNRMLQYSVAARRWTWDCEVIDMQMISAEVAGLLTTRFSQLPLPLMQTVIVTSCFGSQVDEPTMELLNAGQLLPFNMLDALVLAINEGILEKAGPIYQFTHDLIHQTVYDGIPTDERKRIHKNIGTILLGSAANDPATYLLAVDQTNLYCKDSTLSTQERSAVANINASAAKFAISTSRFEQARSYVDMGISLLEDNRWEGQYTLSLQLYEMSASISAAIGDIDSMAGILHECIANVKTFEDSLMSSSLLAKMLAASSNYDDAMDNCLNILSSLGETFPQEIDLPTVLNELSVIQSTLANINVDLVRGLPRMYDESKLNAMKFLSMLCSYSIQAKPLMVPILGCRMVRIMIEHGFCDDCIVGLVTAGYSLFSFTDDIELGYRIGKVGESFIEESPNKHALRSRLCFELDSTLKAVVEPMQSAVANCPGNYDSAMLTGDIGCAMHSLVAHCIGSLHIGLELGTLSKSFVACIKQSTKYRQNTMLWLAMSAFGAVLFLSGSKSDDLGVEVKNYEELNTIGKREKHFNLLYQNFFNEMSCFFWSGNYKKVTELSQQHKPTGQKRILELLRTFFEGIAALTLARQTGEMELRKTGVKALEKMLGWEKISKWNFALMARLLEAQLYFLDGDTYSADTAYKASIASARAHKFLHYEALACELHGKFCMETNSADEGPKQLQAAVIKYRQWGATRKVNELQQFIDANPGGLLKSAEQLKPSA